MTNGNDLAYPLDIGEGLPETGLTKREQFSAMAMQGFLSCVNTYNGTYNALVKDSVKLADALIDVLNKPEAQNQ